MVTRRKARRGWTIMFRPFKDKLVSVGLKVNGKIEAKAVEVRLLTACRSGDYATLDPVSREACHRMFRNQGWEIPPELGGHVARPTKPQNELNLWKAVEHFLKYPGVHSAKNRWRHEISLEHIVDHMGKDRPLKSIWIPDLKVYQVERQKEGAAPATINRELSTLSRLFGVMIELKYVDVNPVQLTKPLSAKSGEREVYLSLGTVLDIAARCPDWYQPILWTSFYTGMRRGELLGLKRKQVHLDKRIILLGPEDTKEGHWKRVPIHQSLVPVLNQALFDSPPLIGGAVFSLYSDEGFHPVAVETFKNCWERACKKLGLEKPWPRFHDLRHTWRTNARRSGIDPQIAESILGHWFRGKSVNERYGRISDQELLDAIDRMTFDHGQTEILVQGAR